ncbi:sulfur carrier protein ThiS [Clostridium sp. OS1-26]|uniref:sulfur carrier protein ThiS n=1 Tax=Clostridium sp. OS1-26 TaxID=3070681 RepID=UPI0027E19D5C|nr:sulfur carrier protein ThiS [Clostridium sp. OS1-26]WML33746.1 sulfur carrier protein ThiS [Clostridium sp. OS1-26]
MIINGEAMDIKEGTTVSELLKILNLDCQKIVVEVDLEILNKNEFAARKLTSESKVEIIRFVGGG